MLGTWELGKLNLVPRPDISGHRRSSIQEACPWNYPGYQTLSERNFLLERVWYPGYLGTRLGKTGNLWREMNTRLSFIVCRKMAADGIQKFAVKAWDFSPEWRL